MDEAAVAGRDEDQRQGGEWTADLVGGELRRAFREMPDQAIFSPRKNVFSLVGLGRAPTPLELIGKTAKYLPREGHIRVHLLAWARSQEHGASFAQTCRNFGWNERTADRNRLRGCKIVAAGLNRDGIPPPTELSQVRRPH